MKKKGLILGSLLTLVASGTVIAGSTYALFTDQTETNIAINAATVDVEAEVTSIELYSPTTIALDGKIVNETNAAINSETEKKFALGGTAKLEGNEVHLENIAPGDKATIKILLRNKSNIAIKYQTVVEALKDNDLFDGLIVTVDGEELLGGITKSNWEELEANKKLERAIEIVIELPTAASKEYMEKSCDILLSVNAVQGNAYVQNEAVVLPGQSQDVLDEIINNASDPVKVQLPKGEYNVPSGSVTDKDITFTGNKDTVIDSTSPVTATGSTLTFDGVTIKYDNDNYEGLQHSTKNVYKNCTIQGTMFLYAPEVEFVDCVFETLDKNTEYSVWTYGAQDVTFTNCTFNTNGKAILVYNELNDFVANVTLNKCKFYDEGTMSGKAAVETGVLCDSETKEILSDNKYNLVFTDCEYSGFDINNSTSPLWGNKNSMDEDHLNVIINGSEAY